MRDYSRDVALIKALSKVDDAISLADIVLRPPVAAALLLGSDRANTFSEAMTMLKDWSSKTNRAATGIWKMRYGTSSDQESAIVKSLVEAGEPIASLRDFDSNLLYRDVFGIPVATEKYEGWNYFCSPASTEEILERALSSGSRWVIDRHGGMKPDHERASGIIDRKTRTLIDDARLFDSCRAMTLWGPPRGGKSFAARQIAEALAGGWVRVCGPAISMPGAWKVIAELRPRAIILDDLDACAGNDDDLLSWFEAARKHARVIVSTMNILPGQEGRDGEREEEHKKHEIRGAVLAPQRAADPEPVLYAELDDEVRATLAPDVPETLRPPDLLAAYLVELQKRAVAKGVSQSDVDEMRRRMKAVGDR